MSMLEYDDLHDKVMFWAHSKGIIQNSDAKSQTLKMVEEAGELCGAVLKKDQHKIIDGLGDVLVTLIILSHFVGEDLLECLDVVHKEISRRTGKMDNGIFVKDSTQANA